MAEEALFIAGTGAACAAARKIRSSAARVLRACDGMLDWPARAFYARRPASGGLEACRVWQAGVEPLGLCVDGAGEHLKFNILFRRSLRKASSLRLAASRSLARLRCLSLARWLAMPKGKGAKEPALPPKPYVWPSFYTQPPIFVYPRNHENLTLVEYEKERRKIPWAFRPPMKHEDFQIELLSMRTHVDAMMESIQKRLEQQRLDELNSKKAKGRPGSGGLKGKKEGKRPASAK